MLRLLSWRLLVASCALGGVALAAREYAVWWTALSQLSCLVAGVTYVAFAFLPRLVETGVGRWIRGGLATVLVLIAVAYLPLQNGNITELWSVLEHLATPALVLLDVLVVQPPRRLPAWSPPTWLLPPAAYLCWYVAADLRVYAALDPDRALDFGVRIAVLAAVTLAAGILVRSRASAEPMGIGRVDPEHPQLVGEEPQFLQRA